MSDVNRYDCRKCGAVGSIPSHRMDCPAHDAGNLAVSSSVRRARQFLTSADQTYPAEFASLKGQSQMRIDLQAAIENVRDVLRIIDVAAIGALI